MSAVAYDYSDSHHLNDRWQHSVSAFVPGGPDQRPVLTRTSTSKSSFKGRSSIDPHDSASLLRRDLDEVSFRSSIHNFPTPQLKDNTDWSDQQNNSAYMTSVRPQANTGKETFDEYWIDRDKLARIERLELEQSGLVAAGTFAHTPNRSPTYSDDEYGPPHGRDDAYESDNDRNGYPRGYSSQSQTHGATPDHNYLGDRTQSYDSTMERASSQGNNTRLPPPVSSRIPIPRLSQTSVAAVAEDSARSGLVSPRSQSTTPAGKKSSHNLNSGGPTSLGSTTYNKIPHSKSPATSKKSGKTTPTNRPRMNSNSANPRRPGTASGSNRTASKQSRAPEGDPPWLDAFRPDPRLPPEEQLLPTVARRQMQEKWRQEGVLATAYDSNCEPLNSVDPFSRVRRRTEAEGDDDNAKEDEDSGSRTPTLQPDAALPPLSSSGRSEHGGYRTIPKLQKPGDTPVTPTIWGVGGVNNSPTEGTIQIISAERVVRVPNTSETEGKPNKKEGCMSCCVVM